VLQRYIRVLADLFVNVKKYQHRLSNDPSIGRCTLTELSTSNGTGAGVLFISPKGELLKYILRLLYKATNNAAKYEALIHGLWTAASLSIKRLIAYSDSKVVIQ
jgi:ribonuclease HI